MDTLISNAHSWCDSQCWHCPLAADCKLCSIMERRQWQHIVKGEDPNDWEIVIRDIEENFKRALALLCAAAEQQGIRFDDDDERPPPPSPSDQRLIDAGRAYCEAVHDLGKSCGETGDIATKLERASLVYVKIGRVTGMSVSDGDELWLEDTAPNLLLIERVEREVTVAVGRLVKTAGVHPGRFLQARAALWRELRPHMERIPRELRQRVDDLVAARRAPSPFCTTARATRAERGPATGN